MPPSPHMSDGRHHPSLTNTNKKTTLCIISMSRIQPGRDSNQGTASSTLSKHLMAAPALEDWPSGPAISRQHHTSSSSALRNRYLQVRVLNHLRIGTRRCKVLLQKWGFNEDGQTACECRDKQTMKHMLVYPILPQPLYSWRPGKSSTPT